MTCEINSINDEWSWRLVGNAKTLAVSQNLLPRMPWELLCFAMDPLEGISVTVKPPESLLQENRNARDACLALFDGSGRTPTFIEMKERVSPMQKDLRSTDRSFAQEISFLFTVAEGLVEQKVRDKILALLQCGDNSTAALSEAYKGIRELKNILGLVLRRDIAEGGRCHRFVL